MRDLVEGEVVPRLVQAARPRVEDGLDGEGGSRGGGRESPPRALQRVDEEDVLPLPLPPARAVEALERLGAAAQREAAEQTLVNF